MKITIITLFPQMFEGPFQYSIIKRAQDKKITTIEFVNLRDFGIGRHKIVDDTPYGGGVGMVLRCDVVDKAITFAKNMYPDATHIRTVLLDARGQNFSQQKAKSYARLDHLILLAGHYEGVDERVRKHCVDESISIGNYVLTGGEIPAMVITDAVIRLIPGVLKPDATALESFSIDGILEHPQYTKPPVFNGSKVPEVLLSGNHAAIKLWRERHSISIAGRRGKLSKRKNQQAQQKRD